MKHDLLKKAAALALGAAMALATSGCIQIVDDAAGYGGGETAASYTEPAAPASQVQYESAQYTVLVYMNGSNLESQGGMATKDLQEMLSSNYPRGAINVVVQTGGTRRWQNNIVQAGELGRYRISENGLEEVDRQPSASMGDPSTLAAFINYGVQTFPAEKYGLVLWNHGGGSVGGYGMDELYNSDGLTLDELDTAFQNSRMASTRFEFLGFDACLMANLETASIAKSYANYLIASEEVEPGYGWDYTAWLNAFGADAGVSGDKVGTYAVQSFVDFYEDNNMNDQPTTLSVTDLSKVDAVVTALEAFVGAADLSKYPYQDIARPRSKAKEFGMPSQYSGDLDMIDLADAAAHFKALLPNEAATLQKAVENAIVYADKGPATGTANGMSIYFPFNDRQNAPYRMQIYEKIGFSPIYTNYLAQFAGELTGVQMPTVDASNTELAQSGDDYTITLTGEQISNTQTIYFTAWMYVEGDYYIQIYQDSDVDIQQNGTITTSFDGTVATVNGQMVCLYEMENTGDHYLGTIPAWLNGTAVNLLLRIDGDNPAGAIVGAYPTLDETNGMGAKNMLELKDGDEIIFAFDGEEFVDTDDTSTVESVTKWYKGAGTTVDGPLNFQMGEVDAGDYMYGFTLVDYYGNTSYTTFITMEFE